MSENNDMYVREHDDEPLLGLPERLPNGERLLWQGSPNFASVARRVFHVNKIIIWFVCIALWQILSRHHATGLWSSDGLAALAISMCSAVALLALLAWFTARATVYTLTSQRVTLRIGIAIPITMNLPFNKISAADVSDFGNDRGNIALQTVDGARVSYWLLWPHARPWRWLAPQPMLLCVDDLGKATDILTAAVADYSNNAAISADYQPSSQGV